jgi:endonuclease/exonuclease/phosphatase (EEP) superfamily protein YafD
MNLRSEMKGAISGLAVIGSFVLAAVSIDFDIPGQALLQTLRFHLGGAMLLGALMLLVLGTWPRALLFALVAAISLGEGGWFVYRLQALRAEAAEAPRTPFMRMLSYNILNGNTENGAAIADYIEGSGADVAFVLEAAPVFPHLAELAAVYPHRFGCDAERSCDLMVLSKTPLVDAQFHDLGRTWSNRLITAETTIDGRTINLVAAHMVKPYFDYASIIEARNLRRVLDGIEGPLVLAGDFNAAPWSDNIEFMVRNSRLVSGPWYPATWPVALGPLGVPIDNMFTRDGLFIETLEAMPDSIGSNHRGLIADISLAN